MPAGRNPAADSIGDLDIILETAIILAVMDLHAADTAVEILAEIHMADHEEVLTDLARDVHLTALHGLDLER